MPVHILVNNSGGPNPGPASEADPESFLGAFKQHLICNQLLMQTFLQGMHGLGLGSSPKVVEAFDLSRFRRLVDLGGATGHLAIAAPTDRAFQTAGTRRR